MRPSNKQRSRNKPGNNGNHNQRRNIGNVINRVFESAGPDGKVRGTPQQIIDKYQALARDAQVSGDRVAAESYLQHSEHYSRILGEAQRQQMESRFGPDRDDGGREDGGRDDMSDRQQRPQVAMAPPVASGLTTIDPDDSYDPGGPIETPEGRRAPADDPAPIVRAASEAMNGAGYRAPEEDAGPEPAKRPRPRRRQKADAPAPAPDAAGQSSS